MSEKRLPSTRSPHLSYCVVPEMVRKLEEIEGQERRDVMTQLAWRPAWAIRSRRGSLQVLREMHRRNDDEDTVSS